MGTFIQLVVDGLSIGSVYAALALAIVLVNQATGLINFAQGGMAVLSAYLAWWFTGVGIPLILAILLSVGVSFLFGAVVERYLMRRFEGGDPDTAVVVTIGLLTLITGVCGWLFTYNNQQFPSLFPLDTISVLGASVSVRSIGTTVVILAIMILLQALFAGTKLGLALRAVAVNPQSAAFSGLPVSRLLMVGWGLAAGLGADVSLLVNNAGMALGQEPVAEADLDAWQRMYATNVIGTTRVTQALLPRLIANTGKIVFITSTAADTSYEGGAGYCGAKAAERMVAGALRLELVDQPVTIHDVAPGMVRTDEFALTRYAGDAERAAAVYAGVAEPLVADDVAEIVRWIAALPAHVDVDRLTVRPRAQAAQHKVHRVLDQKES